MKTFITLFTVAFLSATTHAAEEPKPLVTLSVKRQLLDSNHEMRGRQGDTKDKTFALRVEITNTSSTTVTDAELTGTVLVSRSTDVSDKVVKEPLGNLAIAPMKPNERITVDLGKITLREVELRNRRFEEKMEEWKVECLQKQIVIGSAVSSDQFAAKEKQVTPPPAKKAGPARQPGKKQKGKAE
ncbi:MAG: hypothetical protein ABIT37_02840 [Luteolibacter sp.]